MKQSILFEKGKLYVVELPEKAILKEIDDEGNLFDPYYQDKVKAALANKVKVKNPELLPIHENTKGRWYLIGKGELHNGNTFPLPADLTFDKETGMLKRIEPEVKSEPYNVTCNNPGCYKRALKDKLTCETHSKAEETQEEMLNELRSLPTHYNHVDDNYTLVVIDDILDILRSEFIIQRKKS